MEKFNIAAIDIGSNATRLLIKSVEQGVDNRLKLSKVLFLRIPLRLGFDVFIKGKISDDKAEQFVRTIKAYKQLMKVYDVKDFRACATSAMRDAKNGKEVIKTIEKETGIQIDIISGDEESQIVYDNHFDLMSESGNFLYVDVGGGSTETIFVHDSNIISSKSYNIGTVRMLSKAVADNVIPQMRKELEAITKDYTNIRIIGSGGNINKLFKISGKQDKRGNVFPVATLEKIYDKLKGMSLEARMQEYNMKPDRADVIIPAAEIFLAIAHSTRCRNIIVPNIGLVDGIINDIAGKYEISET